MAERVRVLGMTGNPVQIKLDQEATAHFWWPWYSLPNVFFLLISKHPEIKIIKDPILYIFHMTPLALWVYY